MKKEDILYNTRKIHTWDVLRYSVLIITAIAVVIAIILAKGTDSSDGAKIESCEAIPLNIEKYIEYYSDLNDKSGYYTTLMYYPGHMAILNAIIMMIDKIISIEDHLYKENNTYNEKISIVNAFNDIGQYIGALNIMRDYFQRYIVKGNAASRALFDRLTRTVSAEMLLTRIDSNVMSTYNNHPYRNKIADISSNNTVEEEVFRLYGNEIKEEMKTIIKNNRAIYDEVYDQIVFGSYTEKGANRIRVGISATLNDSMSVICNSSYHNDKIGDDYTNYVMYSDELVALMASMDSLAYVNAIKENELFKRAFSSINGLFRDFRKLMIYRDPTHYLYMSISEREQSIYRVSRRLKVSAAKVVDILKELSQ